MTVGAPKMTIKPDTVVNLAVSGQGED